MILDSVSALESEHMSILVKCSRGMRSADTFRKTHLKSIITKFDFFAGFLKHSDCPRRFRNVWKRWVGIAPLGKSWGCNCHRCLPPLPTPLPISHLSFLSKLTERVVKLCLVDYLSTNNLLNSFQSACIKHHSTETTLLSVDDDVIKAMSHQKVICLTVLDLSAAFYTIDHSILLERLPFWFGIFFYYSLESNLIYKTVLSISILLTLNHLYSNSLVLYSSFYTPLLSVLSYPIQQQTITSMI